LNTSPSLERFISVLSLDKCVHNISATTKTRKVVG
jgi:hypothetical protein